MQNREHRTQQSHSSTSGNLSDIRPVPLTAINLWFDGTSLIFTAPANHGEPAVHLKLPLEKCQIETTEFGSPKASQLGWAALLSILKARYSSTSRKERTFGTKAGLHEYMLEALLKSSIKPQVLSKRKAKETLTMEDLDL